MKVRAVLGWLGARAAASTQAMVARSLPTAGPMDRGGSVRIWRRVRLIQRRRPMPRAMGSAFWWIVD